MKKRPVFHGAVLFMAVILSVIITSCSKDENGNEVYRESGSDQVIADNLYADVLNQVDLATRQLENDLYHSGLDKSTLDGGCATITIQPFDTVNWPKTITVDFGETNCEGIDGKYRRGKLTGTITGRYRDSLTQITITPTDYYVNNYKIEGLKSVTNLGHISGGKATFSIAVQDGVITNPDGQQATWESERTRIWVEGEETGWPSVMDDVFEISGTANGTTYSDNHYYIESLQPLRVERSCEWIVSGVLELTPEGYSTRTLNYGDGTCDNKATVLANGITIEITLP